MKNTAFLLSPRLKMTADMVRSGSVFADIGTDHGYLAAYLILNGICSKGIAADLKVQPLNNAKRTLNEYDISDKVQLILSDGLDSIPENSCDDIILAGMGGDLINDILIRTDWIRRKGMRIIAQPQSHSEKVRSFFIENGYEIIRENACEDDRRNYICMCAEYTGKSCEYDFGYEYYGKIPDCPCKSAEAYLLNQRNRYLKRAEGLRDSGQNLFEALYLFDLCNKFDEIIKDWNEKND